jgi:hypothetical protein
MPEIIIIKSGNKAGNATYDITPPAGYRYDLIAFRVTVTTDITVANRFVSAAVLDSVGAVITQLPSSAVCAASGSTGFSAYPLSMGSGALAVDAANLYVNAFLSWTSTMKLRFTCNNGVAGDVYTVNVLLWRSPA